MSRINEYRAKGPPSSSPRPRKSIDLNSRVMLLGIGGKAGNALANTVERNESKYGESRAA